MGSGGAVDSALYWAHDGGCIASGEASSSREIRVHGGRGQVGMILLRKVERIDFLKDVLTGYHSPMDITGHPSS